MSGHYQRGRQAPASDLVSVPERQQQVNAHTEEDALEKSNTEEMMLGGHEEEGDQDPQQLPQRQSSFLTEELAAASSDPSKQPSASLPFPPPTDQVGCHGHAAAHRFGI